MVVQRLLPTLPLLALACTEGAEGVGLAASETGDSAQDSGASDADSLPAPIADALANSDGGPLGPLLLPEDVSVVPRWEVRLATSADGQSWTASDTVIAWSLTSLSGIVFGDVIVLTVGIEMAKARPLGVPDPLSAVAIIVTEDLATWNSAEIPIADTVNAFITDPALWVDDEEALHVVYFSSAGGAGDPAGQEGAHDIYDAVGSEDTFVEGAAPIYSAEGLADPVILRVGGEWTLFTTEFANAVTLATSADAATFTRDTTQTWDTVSVPSGMYGPEGTVELVAQHLDGRDVPDRAHIGSDGVLAVDGPLYDAHPWGNNCTSPVVLPWKGGFVLFCAVRVEV